jgi:chromosome segregation ATPase
MFMGGVSRARSSPCNLGQPCVEKRLRQMVQDRNRQIAELEVKLAQLRNQLKAATACLPDEQRVGASIKAKDSPSAKTTSQRPPEAPGKKRHYRP